MDHHHSNKQQSYSTNRIIGQSNAERFRSSAATPPENACSIKTVFIRWLYSGMMSRTVSENIANIARFNPDQGKWHMCLMYIKGLLSVVPCWLKEPHKIICYSPNTIGLYWRLGYLRTKLNGHICLLSYQDIYIYIFINAILRELSLRSFNSVLK